MSQKSWWAYIPEVFEEGVVVDAHTAEEAAELASPLLSKAAWADFAFTSYSEVVRNGFYLCEIGPLHFCNFIEEEEE